MPSTMTLTAPAGFFDTDWKTVLAGRLHDGSDELGQLLLYKVSSRTPVDTGALLSDEYYVAHPAHDDPIIAEVLAGTENQMEQWGREYDVYQEGGALGLQTYTNAPHEMFGKVLTDDIPDIETWGVKWLQGSLDDIAAQTGESV